MTNLVLSKYDCEQTLNHLELLVHRIQNHNLKLDYNIIYKKLQNKLNFLENTYPNQKNIVTKNYHFYTLNYEMEKYITEINKTF